MESVDYGDSFIVEGDSAESHTQSQGMTMGTPQPTTPAGPFRRFTLPRLDILTGIPLLPFSLMGFGLNGILSEAQQNYIPVSHPQWEISSQWG